MPTEVLKEPKPRKRRKKGTGSVRRLPSGHWRATLRLGGIRYSQTKEFKADATSWLTAQREQVGIVLRGHAPGTRLEALKGAYLEEVKRRGYTERTVESYTQELGIVLERWGKLRLAEIDPPRLQQILTEMHRLKWAPSTTRNRIDRITALVRFAQEVGLVGQRSLRIRRPRLVTVSQPGLYSAEEKQALIKAAEGQEDPRYLIALLLGLRAGLRRSEIFRFRRGDLDASRGILRVPVRSATDRPKSGRERSLPVPTSLVEAVKRSTAKGDQPVIYREGWGSLWAMYERLEALWDGAGVERGGQWLHKLRHTWATDCGLLGVPVPLIMSWAGWTTIPVFLRYFHGPAATEDQRVQGLDGP